MKKFNEFLNEDNKEIVKFSDLDKDAQRNAVWEVGQRNKVGKSMNNKQHNVLSITNSLFYTNGVFAKLMPEEEVEKVFKLEDMRAAFNQGYQFHAGSSDGKDFEEWLVDYLSQ